MGEPLATIYRNFIESNSINQQVPASQTRAHLVAPPCAWACSMIQVTARDYALDTAEVVQHQQVSKAHHGEHAMRPLGWTIQPAHQDPVQTDLRVPKMQCASRLSVPDLNVCCLLVRWLEFPKPPTTCVQLQIQICFADAHRSSIHCARLHSIGV